jgi:biofilm PGA synthesis N-glycosyltransferase PgaC
MNGVAGVIFLLSGAFVIFTLAGYPVALALVTLLRFRPVVRRYEPKSVTILLPVRNGERWLRTKLESLFALRYPPELVQILVISDGSTDGTDDLAREYAASRRIEFLRVAGGGKAVALNAGLDRADGEIVFLTDVRQQLDPDSLKNLVACFADPSVGVASGELVIREGRTHEEASVGLYWRYEKWLRKRESCIHSVMGATGCIYAIRRALVTQFPPGTLVDDMFLPLSAFFKGYRVIVEESAKAFDYPTALETEFQRKVRTQAGVYQIMGLFPQLLTPRNRMWLAFLSHKLARLLMPFALVLAAIASFGLSQPWRSLALTAQAGFYSIAVLDHWIPERSMFKGISAAIRSFTVLMAAAFCAAIQLLRPPGTLWNETRVRIADPPADA